jgi:hypothetical protein
MKEGRTVSFVCPECQCPSHGFLGETRPDGTWRRRRGLRIDCESTFPMELAPPFPSEG